MQQVSEYRPGSANRPPETRREMPRRARMPHGDSRRARVLRGFIWAGTNWPATFAALLFLASASAYAAVLGGHVSKLSSAALRFSDGAASSFGLSASNVSISGLERATREDILEIVGVREGGSIVGFNARDARRRLEEEDWIASASILRQFPNTLHVEIVEREPFALWQLEGEFSVIDSSGVRLSKFNVRDHLDLPIVVGTGAETNALLLINELEAWDNVKSGVRAAVRVADRRWNLYFNNGIKVLLPEEDVERALFELDRLHREHDVLNRAVDVVDLRVRERTVLRLTDRAGAAREAKLAEVSRR